MAGIPPRNRNSWAADGNGHEVNSVVPFIMKVVRIMVAIKLSPTRSRYNACSMLL